jgi:hypothetical protein
MNETMAKVLTQRGKVVALFVVCGTVVSLANPQSAGAIFAALSVPVAALAAVGEWASSKDYMQGSVE